MFGDIPLVPRTTTDAAGTERTYFWYDRDYAPPLPPGAVRGDVKKQQFCEMCHVPRYFYVDLPRVCVQCNEPFVFRAKEQKHWYENLKFHFDSTATRCLSCRRHRRSEHALHQQLADAKQRAGQAPNDARVLLALAEAIVRYAQRTGRGPLAEAIASARKARRLLRGHPEHDPRETLFWEAMAQVEAGRPAPARALLEEFLGPGLSGRKHTALAKDAEEWLAKTDPEAPATPSPSKAPRAARKPGRS